MSITRYCQAGHAFEVDGDMSVGETIIVTVSPKEGFRFVRWDDGNTDNPREICIAECGMKYIGIFEPCYTVTVDCNETEGEVSIEGYYEKSVTFGIDETATIKASPKEGYMFSNWTNGRGAEIIEIQYDITDNTTDTYTAHFESIEPKEKYTVNAVPNDSLYGNTYGSGKYEYGTEIEIGAIPEEGAEFVEWDDGSTDNPRTLIINSDIDIIAYFNPLKCTITTNVLNTINYTVNSYDTDKLILNIGEHKNVKPGIGTITGNNIKIEVKLKDGIHGIPNMKINGLDYINPYMLKSTVKLNDVEGTTHEVDWYSTFNIEALGNITFVRWDDGSTENKRTGIQAEGNKSYIAEFNGNITIEPYFVNPPSNVYTLSVNESDDTVTLINSESSTVIDEDGHEIETEEIMISNEGYTNVDGYNMTVEVENVNGTFSEVIEFDSDYLDYDEGVLSSKIRMIEGENNTKNYIITNINQD